MTKRIDPKTRDRIRRDAQIARLRHAETHRHIVPTQAPDGRPAPNSDRLRRSARATP